MIVWLSAAIGVGLVVALIARAKGGSLLPWWIYGTVLAPIALPHALILRGMPEPDWRPERFAFLQREPTPPCERCSHCGAPLHAEALVCLKCGRAVYDPGTLAPDTHSHEKHADAASSRAATLARSVAPAIRQPPEGEVPKQWDDEFGRLAERDPDSPPPEPVPIPPSDPLQRDADPASEAVDETDEEDEKEDEPPVSRKRSWADFVPAAHGRLFGDLPTPAPRTTGAVAGFAGAAVVVIGAIFFAWREVPRYSELPASAPTDLSRGSKGADTAPRAAGIIPPAAEPVPQVETPRPSDQKKAEIEPPTEALPPPRDVEPAGPGNNQPEAQEKNDGDAAGAAKGAPRATVRAPFPPPLEKPRPQDTPRPPRPTGAGNELATLPTPRANDAGAPPGTGPTAAPIAALVTESHGRDETDEVARAFTARTALASSPSESTSQIDDARQATPQEASPVRAKPEPTPAPTSAPANTRQPEPEPATPTIFANIVQRALRDLFGERVNAPRPAKTPDPVESSTPLSPSDKSITASGELVAVVQRKLKERGYDPGPVDGRAGPRTRAAILAFERASGAPQNGKVDLALLQRLGVVGAEIPAFNR